MPPKTVDTSISKETLAFLDKGRTTKTDVLQTLGNPRQTNETDSEWVYELRAVLSGRWGYCIAIPPGYGGCGVSDGKAIQILLQIDFDDAGVVTGWNEFRGPAYAEPGIEDIYEELTVGWSTRADVIADYGEPTYGDIDGTSALYAGNGRSELYLEFNAQNVLLHAERIDRASGSACVETGVCIIRYGNEFVTLFVDQDPEIGMFLMPYDVSVDGDALVNYRSTPVARRIERLGRRNPARLAHLFTDAIAGPPSTPVFLFQWERWRHSDRSCDHRASGLVRGCNYSGRRERSNQGRDYDQRDPEYSGIRHCRGRRRVPRPAGDESVPPRGGRSQISRRAVDPRHQRSKGRTLDVGQDDRATSGSKRR